MTESAKLHKPDDDDAEDKTPLTTDEEEQVEDSVVNPNAEDA
jgi:hypothetical protein